MDALASRVLRALVEGYEARAQMKERGRALTEYEIARRAGLTSASYTQFSDTPEREQLRQVLDELEQRGSVAATARAGRYLAYQPTPEGVRWLRRPVPSIAEVATEPPLAPATATLTDISRQLDEVIRLLRAIDAKLGRAP
ncbi:MAG: hypothetical protein IRZ14_04545 [Chloroflexi bacterium]|nr:hypothetical protein [Chloroflexota bacterium]